MTWEFVFDNGQTGITTVNSELLDTESRAKQRAISEFMKGGVKKKRVRLKSYIGDLKTGDIVQIEGLDYRIVSKAAAVNDKSITFTYEGVHYVT